MANLFSRIARAATHAVRPLTIGVLALLTLVAALYADRHLAHGVRARFLTDDDVPITATIEHRTSFPNGRRLIARVVEGWDRLRTPAPTGLLWFRVELSGDLEVPPGAPRTLTTNYPNTNPPVQITIDGRPGTQLMPGRRRVVVRFRMKVNQVIQGIALSWQPEGGAPEPIPNAAFGIPGGAPTTPRVLVWALALLAFGAVAYAVQRALGPPRDTAPLRLVLIVLIGALGFGLRVYDYDVVPHWDDTHDEMYTGWDGVELLRSGRTRGWSIFELRYPPHVTREDFRQFGTHYTVLSPVFEHPPLMHLLAGITERAFGTTRYQDARISHVRIPSLLLFIPTLILLYLLARKLVPEGYAAHIACLIYAVQPTIAISSRHAKEEVLVTPLVLGAMLMFTRFELTRRTRDAFLIGLILGIGILTKVPAAFFAVGLVVLVLRVGGLRPAVFTALGTSIGVGLLLIFAACIDLDVFLSATRVQATIRATHFNLFPRYFTDAYINRLAIGRGHLLFLWLAYFVAIRGRDGKIDARGIVPPLTYLGMLAVSAGDFNYGWYMLPVYPFLCIYAGRFVQDVIVRPNVAHGLLMIGLLLMYSCCYVVDFAFGRTPEGWAVLRGVVAGTFYSLFVPLLAATAMRHPITRNLARTAMAACFAGFVVISAYMVVEFERIRGTHENFDRDDFYDS
jgi:4-amino-4-deoxy-L-arabinose transferase-like glycosyltransferase